MRFVLFLIYLVERSLLLIASMLRALRVYNAWRFLLSLVSVIHSRRLKYVKAHSK